MNFYNVIPGEGSLTLITERYQPDQGMGMTLYLVEGAERAALVDSGMGVAQNLRQVVEGLTDKSVDCILTHGHPDHAGAAPLFDKVYMNEGDVPLLPVSLSPERRLGDVEHSTHNDPEIMAFCRANYVDCSEFSFENFENGHIFDLGGVTLEAVHVPGHTAGSMALLNRKENYVLLGDAVNPRTALVASFGDGSVLRRYRDGIQYLCANINEETRVYTGHSVTPLDHAILYDMAQAAQEVIDGKREDDVPSQSMFAKRIEASGKRMFEHTCGKVILVYNANEL